MTYHSHGCCSHCYAGILHRNLLVLLLTFLVSACSVHDSRVDESAVRMPSSYVETAGNHTIFSYGNRWWLLFGDSVLNRLVEDAVSGNLDIHVAFERLEQAMAIARQIDAARYPSIGFSGEASRSRVPSFFEDVTGGSYRLEFQAGYEVDLWQKYKNAADAASFDANASMEDVRGVFISVAAQVADLYFTAVEQRQQLGMVQDIVRSANLTLSFVERRYMNGLVEALDLYQARQALKAAEARLPLHETLLAQSEHAISILCGHFPQREITGDFNVLNVNFKLPDAGLPADLLQRRPDIRKAFFRLKAADADVAAAVADLYPAFRIGVGFGQSQSLMTSSPIVGEFWNLFAGVTQPLFEGGRRRAEVDRRRAMLSEAVLDYRKSVLQAVREVEDAIAACRGSAKRIKRLEQWVNAASNSLKLAGNRYAMGMSEYLPVLTAQAAELEAKSQLINARRIYLSDLVALYKALGGGWMDYALVSVRN